MNKQEKAAEIDSIRSALEGGHAAFVLAPKGLPVNQVTVLRRKIRASQGRYRVLKNRLALRAIDTAGLSRSEAAQIASGLTMRQLRLLELARALATKPRVLLLDEVAGGLTEHECAALLTLIRNVRTSGISIIWIEHVVHALLAVVDRLLVLHGGGFIAEGDPQSVIRSPQVAEIYMGIPTDA